MVAAQEMTNQEKLNNVLEALELEKNRADRTDLLLQAILYAVLTTGEKRDNARTD